MKRIQSIGIIVIIVGCVIGLWAAYYINKNWVYRYEAELDQFFGEGNWEYISKETRESNFLSEHYYSSRHAVRTGSEPGKFNNWYIYFKIYFDKEYQVEYIDGVKQ